MDLPYNASNSLSPMMFREMKKAGEQGGTRNERWRSRSVENILETVSASDHQRLLDRKGKFRPNLHPKRTDVAGPPWKEISAVKKLNPVIACILPSLAMDFVTSALLAVGATPLVTEDPSDVHHNLSNAKAVLVDVSAPQVIVESFIHNFKLGNTPLILVTSDCGTNDRKKELAMRIIEESGPTVITGRLGDIYAISQVLVEKASCSDDSDNESDGAKETSSTKPTTTPKLVLSSTDIDHTNVPPSLRRFKNRKGSGPDPLSSSAPTSPHSSPRTSPRGSPASSPLPVKGFRKFLNRKVKSPNGEGKGLRRVPTCIPRLHMKGQFRAAQMSEIPVMESLEYGQRLAAHTKALIHLYEINVVTSGEVIVEINNTQLGMGNLHSILACAGGVTAAVLASANILLDDQDEIVLKDCAHALALYYVAAEEAGANTTTHASAGKELISPGTLREQFLDALHYMDEAMVHLKANIVAHMEGTGPY